MCSDENGAPHASRYLNAQLAVLHENAKKCLEEHPQSRTEENKHFYALAEYVVQRSGVVSQFPSESESLFAAIFQAPTIQFICDHNVFLHLRIENGHLALDNSRNNRSHPIRLPSEGQGLEVTYRVNFETRTIVGKDTKIGDYGSVIELVILDLKNATVSSIVPEQTSGRDALLRYLQQYLDVLHQAGNHVLFSLPQFDQRNARMEIDYSLMDLPVDFEWQETIYGVTTEQVNAYMSSLWLKSAMLAYGRDTGITTDWRARCYAEFSRKEADTYFRIKFGTPRVNILCAREVVVYFDVDEVEFFDGEDFSVNPVKKFNKWKIAMVVGVLQARGEDDHLAIIAFDLTNGRYHHPLSQYSGLNKEDELSLEYQEIVIAFFAEEYLSILQSAGYHIIYSHDSRWETIQKIKLNSREDAEGSWWKLGELGEQSGAAWRETIQQTKMYGFDQVIAISQGSINAQFSASSHLIFHSWAYENFFSSTFKPLSIHLLSSNKAILWVHLTNGSLKTLREWVPWDGEPYEFRDWRIAFEVELKMCSQEELEGAESTAYKSTFYYEKHGTHADRDLHHIYLDLRHAEYLHEYSTYNDIKVLNVEDSRSVILRLQAVVHYLSEFYFPALCRDGLNVISSVPVWKSGTSLPSYALTSVGFHVYSRIDVTRYNWTHVTAGMEPIIVIVGTTGYRPLPSRILEFSTGWIVNANGAFSHGTLSISKRVFIEERLLYLLANVNALTTMIPVMIDPLQGSHGLTLKRWADHDLRKDRPSKWVRLPSDGEGCLKYLWEHSEEWRYKLSGSGDIMNATQAISCITRNYVELPTAVKQGALHIKISGKVELSLANQTEDTTARSYSATSSVSWSTNVTVQTTVSGIKVHTVGSHDPVFAQPEFTDGGAARFRNPAEMLRDAFPHKVDLEELVQEIRAFEGAWEYCCPPAQPYALASPVFNEDGDLLFELRRGGAGGGLGRGAATSPGMSRSGSPGPKRPGSRIGHRGHGMRPTSRPTTPTRGFPGKCCSNVLRF
ncbi:hypothetical protein C8Q78DRAFT_981541 [Trametes maxima]|nr:hypothetical protein C8Q78DRAFT_981541 [Trametes maxima]